MNAAASVVGIVSLGIQVCQGITWYYGEWKDCPDDVMRMVDSVKSLRKTLELFEPILSDKEIETDPKQRVEECIIACSEAIRCLGTERKKFDEPAKIKWVVRRLTYPFKASTLSKLQESADEVLDRLSMVVQALDLTESKRLHSRTQAALEEVKKLVTAAYSDIEEVRLAVGDLSVQSMELLGVGKQTARDVQGLLTSAESGEKRRIIAWIGPPNVQEKHDSAIRKRLKGSGQWFLASKEYHTWKTSFCQHMWLQGASGCGKTFLASTIIDDMEAFVANRPTYRLAYFSFSFSDNGSQSYKSLLSAIAAQLVRSTHRRAVLERIDFLYDGNHQHPPTTSTLEAIVTTTVQVHERVYVVIDALDECPDGDGGRPDVFDGLCSLVEEKCKHKLHMLVTSRPEEDIKDCMHKFAQAYVMNTKAVDKDIANYVADRLSKEMAFQKPAFQEQRAEIQKQLSSGAQGVSVWVWGNSS